jgi:CBS domain-containing protein
MRDRSYSFSMMAPFTIFPLPAEDVADLCLGFIEIYSVLNASLLEGAFARAGIKASVFTPPESNGRFLEAEFRQGNRILVVQVSPQLREQLLLELMTPANVIGAVQGLARELDRDAPGEQEGHIVALSDEGRVWESL